MSFTLPEDCKLLCLQMPTASSGFTLSDYVCMKNVVKAWFIVSEYGQGGNTALTVGLKEATDVAGGTNAAVNTTVNSWTDFDHGTASDGLTYAADANASVAIATGGAADGVVILEWDPTKHTAGYDCVAVTGSGGHAANIVTVLAVLESRYPQRTPPSAIID